MTSRYAYAVKDDWLDLCAAVEGARSVSYVPYGPDTTPDFTEYRSAAELPDVGRATRDSSLGCDAYLIAPAGHTFRVREVRANDGRSYFYLDQLLNPETVELTFGGEWEPGVLIAGKIGTASDHPDSRALFAQFRRETTKRFTRVGAYWVGERALRLLEDGWRFTQAVQMPRGYDLRP